MSHDQLGRDDMLHVLELLPMWQARQVSVLPKAAAGVLLEAPAATIQEIAQETLPESSPEAPTETANPAAVNLSSPIFTTETDKQSKPLTLAAGRRASIQHLDWTDLQSCVQHCQACGLHKTRTQTVFGIGDTQPDWLIVGEAPGMEEDASGEPFVGQAGKLLDSMLAALGLKRGEKVYIANVLKCRPPDNRNPMPEEVQHCQPFLLRQIALLQPRVILALGRFAAQTLLESEQSIGALRGQVHQVQGIPLVATYHPAYLLRNLPEKAKAWQDLCLARQVLEKRN
jgi:DNA polymerase